MSFSREDYGWSDHFERSFAALHRPELASGRVTFASGENYRIIANEGQCSATPSGRLRHAAELPVIGDWVAYARDHDHARIETVLPRRSQLSRKVAGKRTREQVVAANVDTVIVVMGLDGDFNPRRLERYLTAVWESGASPVVLLNKVDLVEDRASFQAEIDPIALGAPVVATSSTEGTGIDDVKAHLAPRETAVLVGSSGAGKSTLINRLLGAAVQRTREVRAGDDRGQHTTTHRELFMLPGGALLIDNPGIRELQLWADESALEHSFEDIYELAGSCRFHDCAHETEPGCAILAAVQSGDLSDGRLRSFRSLQRELRYLERRQDESAERVEKAKWRAIHREMRRSGRHRRT